MSQSPARGDARPDPRKRRYTDKYFALPAVVWIAITTQIPFIATVVFSMVHWNLVRPDQGVKFAKLENYAYYFWGYGSAEFWAITGQTLLLVVIALAGCTIFGFLLSLLLDHQLPGINVVRTLILGPFFVMSTTTGVIWKVTILNMTFGWYALISGALGLPLVDFLSHHSLSLIAFLFIWQWMPFFVLIILGGLQSLPGEVLESANIDGANWFVTTFNIKLPMIMNHMQTAIMLGLIFLIKEFGLILVTTAGGPGKSSYSLAYYIYDIVFTSKRVGRAATISVLTVLIVTFAVNALSKAIKRRSEMLS
ncbi:carbohydrate ABC transporter permease [Bacillota bacterium Meth-B3]|nr:sugar ABC transporter permease [Christensenellaceae bacterium]MEA5065286.1 sugar ABC transporter permease [Eubacteriales bacterium]MEA5069880.1 sugar ABC transporter permease [Christensenellaceae bacterium]